MKRHVHFFLAALLWCAPRPALATATTWQQDPKIDSTTLWHFLVSGGGTVIGSQLYQYYGMDETAANVISPIEMLGVGLVKAFYIDNQLKPYSLAANGLGLLVGSIINLSLHVDYARQHKNSVTSRAPAPTSPLAFSYRDELSFTRRKSS